jgi:hypothetical protein
LITRIKEKELKKFFKELVQRSQGVEIRISGSFTNEILKEIPPAVKIISSEKELLAV